MKKIFQNLVSKISSRPTNNPKQERFGIEDNTFNEDRSVNLNSHDIELNNGNLILMSTGNGVLSLNPSGVNLNSTGNQFQSNSEGTGITSFGSDATYSLYAMSGDSYKYAGMTTFNNTTNKLISLKIVNDSIELSSALNNVPEILKLFIRNMPIYNSEAEAIGGGMETDQLYKTSTGELRIKL